MKKLALLFLFFSSQLVLAGGSDVGDGGGLGTNPTKTAHTSSAFGVKITTTSPENPFNDSLSNDYIFRKSNLKKVVIDPAKVEFVLDSKGNYFQPKNSLKQEVPAKNLESIGLESGQIIYFK